MRKALGFESTCCRNQGSRLRFHEHCTSVALFYFSCSSNCPCLNQALEDFYKTGKPFPHQEISKYYLNAYFSCCGLEHLSLHKDMFLYLWRLKISLELLKALSEPYSPIPICFTETALFLMRLQLSHPSSLFPSPSSQLVLPRPPFARFILSSNQ